MTQNYTIHLPEKVTARLRPLVLNKNFYTFVADPLERAGRTAVQILLVLLLPYLKGLASDANQYVSIPWVHLFEAVGLAAAASLITTGISILTGLHATGYTDLVVRAAKSFLQAYAALVILDGVVNYNPHYWIISIGPALGTAITSLMMSLAAVNNPQTLGASMIKVLQLQPTAEDAEKMSIAVPVEATPVVEPPREHSGVSALGFDGVSSLGTGASFEEHQAEATRRLSGAPYSVQPYFVQPDSGSVSSAPAKKAPVKKAVAKKAVAKKAPAKKVVAKKVPAKKAVAKKQK